VERSEVEGEGPYYFSRKKYLNTRASDFQNIKLQQSTTKQSMGQINANLTSEVKMTLETA